MIRGGFLKPEVRADLIALVRNGKAETRLTRRANALLLLDDGMSCTEIGESSLPGRRHDPLLASIDSENGLSWLADFGYKGRACELTTTQQDELRKWVAETLPRTTGEVGEWIEKVPWRELHLLGPRQAVDATGIQISQAPVDTAQA
jgi:hypothetical protein